MTIRGVPMTFDFGQRIVNFRDRDVPMPGTGRLSVRLLIDRASVELFLDGGKLSASFCYLPDAHIDPLVFRLIGGNANLDRVRVKRVNDVWRDGS